MEKEKTSCKFIESQIGLRNIVLKKHKPQCNIFMRFSVSTCFFFNPPPFFFKIKIHVSSPSKNKYDLINKILILLNKGQSICHKKWKLTWEKVKYSFDWFEHLNID